MLASFTQGLPPDTLLTNFFTTTVPKRGRLGRNATAKKLTAEQHKESNPVAHARPTLTARHSLPIGLNIPLRRSFMSWRDSAESLLFAYQNFFQLFEEFGQFGGIMLSLHCATKAVYLLAFIGPHDHTLEKGKAWHRSPRGGLVSLGDDSLSIASGDSMADIIAQMLKSEVGGVSHCPKNPKKKNYGTVPEPSLRERSSVTPVPRRGLAFSCGPKYFGTILGHFKF